MNQTKRQNLLAYLYVLGVDSVLERLTEEEQSEVEKQKEFCWRKGGGY